jgi:hypothetical protein
MVLTLSMYLLRSNGSTVLSLVVSRSEDIEDDARK